MSLLVLSSSDVDAITSTFSPQDLQLLMAQVFALVSSNGERTSMPPRIVIPTLNHTALVMPAHISTEASSDLGISNQSFALGGTAVKIVCVPAKSDPRGLPGTTLVLDQMTGGVKAVVNARKLTALRNAAGSLLSTSLIGPSTPRKIVAFGAGRQIEAHLDLFIRHFPSISDGAVVNRTINVRSNALKEIIQARFRHINLDVISSEEHYREQMKEAVRSADIIICATSSTVPLFPSSWVRTGTHVILIGSFTPAMREVEKELVLRAISPNVESPCLLVDSRKACLEEAGELIDAKVEPHQMTEIGELVGKDVRLKDCGCEGITMFKSVGIGLQDVAMACAVVDRAQGVGTEITGYDSITPTDSRLLSNLLQQEKDYLKQFNQLFNASAASLDSLVAYAAASPPTASQVILAVANRLAAADDALKRYVLGVDQWRDAMKLLKDMEDDVGNILRDREILVTRLIKVSKSHKSNSGTFRGSLSSSSLSLPVDSSRPASVSFQTSSKLSAAQSELQACETHLASQEIELASKRSAAVREGLCTRAKAMIDCGRTWGQLGREILDSLGIIEAQTNVYPPSITRDQRNQIPPTDSARPSSDTSSIGPSQSASQTNCDSQQLPEPINIMSLVTNPDSENTINDNTLLAPDVHRPQSSTSTAASSYYTPALPATYKLETVTYAPAVALRVPGKEDSSPILGSGGPSDLGSPFDLNSLGPLTTAHSPRASATAESLKDQSFHLRIPAAHAINEHDIPISQVVDSGTTDWRHSRGESQEGSTWVARSTPQPQRTSVVASDRSMTNLKQHNSERRIPEEELRDHISPAINSGGRGQASAPNKVVASALIEVFDDTEDEREEDDELPNTQMIQQGKFAVVENPTFMSEKRKRELEREKERAPMKAAGEDSDPEKKKFSFLPQRHKRTGTSASTQIQSDTGHVTFAPATPSTSKTSPLKVENLPNSTSPSKTSPSKRFFGSLKGLFGVPLSGSPQSQIHTLDDYDSDVDPGDGVKKKTRTRSTGGTRWSMRTDRNIRMLSRERDDDLDGYFSQASGHGSGIAGNAVANVGLVGVDQGVGARSHETRKRSASDTLPAAVSTTPKGGGKKLKKALPPSASTRASASDVETRAPPTAVTSTPIPAATASVANPTAAVSTPTRKTSVSKTQTPTIPNTPATNINLKAGGSRQPLAQPHPTSSSSGGGAIVAAAGVTHPKSTPTRETSIGKTQTPTPNTPGTNIDNKAGASHPRPTPTRKTSTGKTQTPTTPNTPATNVNIKTGGSGQHHAQPQPHHHPASSSSGGAIILAAGGTHPSGTLISHPGWDTQALPTPGGGLSRNNSIMSAVSAAGGSSGGSGMSKTKKQTMLGHGMGSGTSLGRKGSLGSSSGHGGGEKRTGSGSSTAPIIAQPTQPSLMSIVEDVAKHNREWNQESSQLLKNRKKILGGGGLERERIIGGPVMVDVVRAPPRVGREELAQLDPAIIKSRVMETSTMNLGPGPVTRATGGGGGRKLVDIKAPGSVLDQRNVKHVGTTPAALERIHLQASNSTPALTQNHSTSHSNLIRRASVTSTPTGTGTKRPAKSPLRSALKSQSRTPSPLPSSLPGPFLVGESGDAGDSTSTNETMFYTDDEGDHSEAVVEPSTENRVARSASPMLNGHAVGYTRVVGGSDLSHSTTSTAVAHHLPQPTTITQRTSPPPRRKSVRVSLQPTFSPSPPAVEYDDEEEQKYHAPWVWEQDQRNTEGGGGGGGHVHAPIPVAAASPLLNLGPRQKVVVPEESGRVRDIWDDSSDEDVEYQEAKRLLTRAAKKEKDMKDVFAASR